MRKFWALLPLLAASLGRTTLVVEEVGRVATKTAIREYKEFRLCKKPQCNHFIYYQSLAFVVGLLSYAAAKGVIWLTKKIMQ